MEKLNTNRKWLFDGIGTEIDNQDFVVTVEEEDIHFSIADVEKNQLRKLKTEIGAAGFEKIIQTEKFALVNPAFEKYASPEKLGIYYLINGNYVLLFALGEFQPGREMLILESVWKND